MLQLYWINEKDRLRLYLINFLCTNHLYMYNKNYLKLIKIKVFLV